MKNVISKATQFIMSAVFCIFTMRTLSVSAISYGNYGSYNDLDAVMDIYNMLGGNFDINNILDIFIQSTGAFGTVIFFGLFIFSAVWCFFGYKIYRIFIAVFGFLVGGVIGILLAAYEQTTAWLLLGLLLAIGMAVLAYKIHKAGLFILGFFSTFPIFFLLTLIIAQKPVPAVVISMIISAALGYAVIKFEKPLVIVSSAVSYGSSAGMYFSCLIANTKLSAVLGVIFMSAGLYVQARMNGGILESGSLIAKLTGKTIEDMIPLKESARCPHCNAGLVPNAEFCMECGKKISEKFTENISDTSAEKHTLQSNQSNNFAESENVSLNKESNSFNYGNSGFYMNQQSFNESNNFNNNFITTELKKKPSFDLQNEEIKPSFSKEDSESFSPESKLKTSISSSETEKSSLIINMKPSSKEKLSVSSSKSRLKQSSDFD